MVIRKGASNMAARVMLFAGKSHSACRLSQFQTLLRRSSPVVLTNLSLSTSAEDETAQQISSEAEDTDIESMRDVSRLPKHVRDRLRGVYTMEREHSLSVSRPSSQHPRTSQLLGLVV